jgi:hypothetical protein
MMYASIRSPNFMSVGNFEADTTLVALANFKRVLLEPSQDAMFPQATTASRIRRAYGGSSNVPFTTMQPATDIAARETLRTSALQDFPSDLVEHAIMAARISSSTRIIECSECRRVPVGQIGGA